MHTDHLDWSLPAHRRGTLSGMDAAPEPTRTYLRRVLRWWAGKGPAAHSQRRGRTCGVSCDGGRARARQHTRSVEDVLAACPATVGGQGPGSTLSASRTYLRRVSRWWACKGLHRIRRSAAEPPADDASSPAAPDIGRHNMACWCF
ncbi:hypothetical protein XaCFBP7622_02135 [Xanthomonas arboricola]|nr:hypothetical protein XaCFBP7622_02135 [Xanthomonas arboricola]